MFILVSLRCCFTGVRLNNNMVKRVEYIFVDISLF